MEELARRLRRLRHQGGKSLKDVSLATGISLSYLSEVERGEATPTISIVQKLARYYGVEPGSLLMELQTVGEEHPIPAAFEELLREIPMSPEMTQLMMAVERQAQNPARTMEDWRELYYALKRLLGR